MHQRASPCLYFTYFAFGSVPISPNATPHLHTDNSHRIHHLLPARPAVSLTIGRASAYDPRHSLLQEQPARILQILHATAATNPHLEAGSRYQSTSTIYASWKQLSISNNPQNTLNSSSAQDAFGIPPYEHRLVEYSPAYCA